MMDTATATSDLGRRPILKRRMKRARPSATEEQERRRAILLSPSVARVILTAIFSILASASHGSAGTVHIGLPSPAASVGAPEITRDNEDSPLSVKFPKQQMQSSSENDPSTIIQEDNHATDPVDVLSHNEATRKRQLEEGEEIITETRQGNVFEMSLSPVSVHLDFRAINQLNSIMDKMLIDNLDDVITAETTIRFSTILLTQEKTQDDGDIPILTVKILKTAFVTIPSSQAAHHMPDVENFDAAVLMLFTDTRQKQELVYKLRETKHYAYTSLWDMTFAGFVDPPTEEPSYVPTMLPTLHPTLYPTVSPTSSPTELPSHRPSGAPSYRPSSSPTRNPTQRPSLSPTFHPTTSPTAHPTTTPTVSPTTSPSSSPTYGFATITVEGNKFDMSLTPMPSPLDFWSTTHLNNALSKMVKRNLVLDFQAKVKFSTVLLFQTMQDDGMQHQKNGWRFGSSRSRGRGRGRGRALTHKRVDLTGVSPPASATLVARVQMTAHVTVPTTGGGRYNTHFVPNMDDIDNAVMTVFADPIQRKELLDSLRDSYDSFSQLTNAGFITFIYPPTPVPSALPSASPTDVPSVSPSYRPSASPTLLHSSSPSATHSDSPSQRPSSAPSDQPSTQPSKMPSALPSVEPTVTHSESPSNVPSVSPSFTPVSVAVKGNEFVLSFSPVTQSLDFATVDMLDAALDVMVTENLANIVPAVYREGISFGTSLVSQKVEGNELIVRLARTAHFTVPAQGPDVPSTNARIPTGEGIDMATRMVFTDVFQRESFIESLQLSSLKISTDSTGIFGNLKEIDFEYFVYPPTPEPTRESSEPPSTQPTNLASSSPSNAPSSQPSMSPTSMPSSAPSLSPTGTHSEYPSSIPSPHPSATPSSIPTQYPTRLPSLSPTFYPTAPPTLKPTPVPSRSPTKGPTHHPSASPSTQPTTIEPSAAPTNSASEMPSQVPSISPTAKPTYLPITLDVTLSDFTLIFSPMDAYLAKGAQEEVNEIIDEMIVDNLMLSQDLGPVQISFDTSVLSQLTSEDDDKRARRRRARILQQRKPDPTLSIAFRKVAHVTVQTLDLFGNYNADAVPDKASFDLALLTMFTDLVEKERLVLSLRSSIARFANLRNVVMMASVTPRMMPPPVVQKQSETPSSSDTIVPGVSNSLFYGIVAAASVVICAVGVVAMRMMRQNRNGGGGKQQSKIQLGTTRGGRDDPQSGSGARPRSKSSSARNDRPRSRSQSHQKKRSRDSHHRDRHHHRHHHLQHPQQPMPPMNSYGAENLNQTEAVTMDEGDSVSELEVGESVVANMIKSRSMMEQEDQALGRPPHHPHHVRHHNAFHGHHHAPHRTTKKMPSQSHLLEHQQAYSDDWGGEDDDYDAIQAYKTGGHDTWNMNRVSTWNGVDAT